MEIALVKIKVIWNSFAAFMAMILVWAGVNEQTYSIFTFLLLTDYVTGISKAYMMGDSITSNKSKYGIMSKASLLIIPIILGLGGKAVGADFSTILYWSMNVLIMSELYSIIANVYSIRTGEELPEFDVLQLIGKRIRDTMMVGKK